MSDDFQERVLRVLADPTRHRIARLTCEGPQHPRDLAKLLGVTSSAVYQHLNALLEVGFIERVEVENRVHYRAKTGISEFMRRFGEACDQLQMDDELGSVPVVEPHLGKDLPPAAEPGPVQVGVLGRFKSSWLEYYVRSPFWSVAVVILYLVDGVLAIWCLAYAVFYSSNPVLTIVGGMLVCGFLAALANYLYQRTKPILQTAVGGD